MSPDDWNEDPFESLRKKFKQAVEKGKEMADKAIDAWDNYIDSQFETPDPEFYTRPKSADAVPAPNPASKPAGWRREGRNYDLG